MKLMRNMWKALKKIFQKKDNSPFALTEIVTTRVSPVEQQVYKLDADRNGKSLSEWIRETLNNGISKQTLVHLSKGSDARQDSLNAVYNMMDEADREAEGLSLLPVRRETMSNKKVSGHPCHNLNPTIPVNFTANECQGVCESRVPGVGGRPCFWGPQAAHQCDAFETKKVIPIRLPTKNSNG